MEALWNRSILSATGLPEAARHELQPCAAMRARLDLDAEHPLEPLRPAQRTRLACDHLQGMMTPRPALRVALDRLAAGAPGKGSDVASDALALTLLLALASALAFACAMIASNVGLRHMSARAGVTVSVPSAAVLFWLALPAFIDPALAAAPISALGIFLAVGLFFPAAVTLLVFESNARLGPTIAATVSCTAPLFAVAAAVLLLGEVLDLRRAAGTLAVVLGIAVLSTAGNAAKAASPGAGNAVDGRGMVLALGAAMLRAAAQILLKIGFVFWASPYAAILAGYGVSAAVILIASRLLARRAPIVRTRRGIPWFILAGVCNGSAMLLMYAALVDGEVSLVAPIVAGYPLFTLLLSALFLGNERLAGRHLLGIAITVAGVALLASR